MSWVINSILMGFHFIAYVLFMLAPHIHLIPFLNFIWSLIYFSASLFSVCGSSFIPEKEEFLGCPLFSRFVSPWGIYYCFLLQKFSFLVVLTELNMVELKMIHPGNIAMHDSLNTLSWKGSQITEPCLWDRPTVPWTWSFWNYSLTNDSLWLVC